MVNTPIKAGLPEGGQGELGGKFVVSYCTVVLVEARFEEVRCMTRSDA